MFISCNLVSRAIQKLIPDSTVYKNKIPKCYVDYELYNNLVYNDDNKVSTYDVEPRMKSLELSYKGYVSVAYNHRSPLLVDLQQIEYKILAQRYPYREKMRPSSRT